MNEVVLDSSFVVAELDARDVLHPKAVSVRRKIEREGLRPVLLDAVINEVVTIVGKRLERSRHQNQAAALGVFLDRVASHKNVLSRIKGIEVLKSA